MACKAALQLLKTTRAADYASERRTAELNTASANFTACAGVQQRSVGMEGGTCLKRSASQTRQGQSLLGLSMPSSRCHHSPRIARAKKRYLRQSRRKVDSFIAREKAEVQSKAPKPVP